MVEVVGSHRHLLLNNMKGVGGVTLLLNEALYQGSARKSFRKEANDGLEAHLLDVGPGIRGEKVVPFHHLISTSPTNIKG